MAWTFLIPVLYWLYLALTTTMVVKYDAAEYEKLASTIYHDGWTGFFKFKPYNVALYPFLISLSMRLADLLGVPYAAVQTAVQILFLLAAQILLYKTLKCLGVGQNILAATLLYFGFSPAFVNSAFSLYCEIITYPLVLGVIILSVAAWQEVRTKHYPRLMIRGIQLAALFLLLSLVRQVNEYVLVFYVLTLFCLSLKFLATRNFKTFINGLLLTVTIFGVYHLSLTPYKAMNYKYNGYKSLTAVGSESLYANAKGRTQPLTTNNILTFLAFVPGERVCAKIFSAEECSFWGDENIHVLGPNKTKELQAQGVANDKIDALLREAAVKSVLSHPLQYAFLTAAEGLKMVFWESTRIGFVHYPHWLETLFEWELLRNGLRLLIFFVTLATLAFSVYYVLRYRNDLSGPSVQKSMVYSVYLFCLVIILANIVLHAPFLIATRYALPIAPLYLMLTALNAQHICAKRRTP